MRTTLTLDDDVAAKVKQLAHREKIPFKQALDSVLRRGLGIQKGVERSRAFRVATFSSPFRPGVDPLRLNQLVDELEVEDAVSARRR